MKDKLILTVLLAGSFLANAILLVYVASQNERLSLLPRLKNEIGMMTSLIPHNLDKSMVGNSLELKGFVPEEAGEFYNAQKPNTTLFVDGTHFVFSPNRSLIQINSLSNSLEPIYEKQ